jgi:ABC-type branched-subunit amino acid transport system ATPase component
MRMLKVKNLEAGYGKLRVLKRISMHVDPGEIVTIIGANGAGKTTLLHTISGLVKVGFGRQAGVFHYDCAGKSASWRICSSKKVQKHC